MSTESSTCDVLPDYSSPQLNISFPATGCQKLIEVDDERKLRTFYEKRMATEVSADPLGDEWKVSLLFSQPDLSDPCLHTVCLLNVLLVSFVPLELCFKPLSQCHSCTDPQCHIKY